ncbi:hypothetical protein [Microlunatus parietis]|uniref:Amino acid permease n=1 Tax=Microlunatus parietis TaxID=682979 RepID=A0A7Y9I7G5_9ACTN|nr:hypothetical protein [Microlunatus parietis]NYE71577.1 hypothetical protein [Microlunatus parietis]
MLILRRDRVPHRHFTVWTPVPVLGILSCLMLLSQQEPAIWSFAAFVMAIGVALLLIMRLAKPDRPARRPQP